jgi:hypothetical protein
MDIQAAAKAKVKRKDFIKKTEGSMPALHQQNLMLTPKPACFCGALKTVNKEEVVMIYFI